MPKSFDKICTEAPAVSAMWYRVQTQDRPSSAFEVSTNTLQESQNLEPPATTCSHQHIPKERENTKGIGCANLMEGTEPPGSSKHHLQATTKKHTVSQTAARKLMEQCAVPAADTSRSQDRSHPPRQMDPGCLQASEGNIINGPPVRQSPTTGTIVHLDCIKAWAFKSQKRTKP